VGGGISGDDDDNDGDDVRVRTANARVGMPGKATRAWHRSSIPTACTGWHSSLHTHTHIHPVTSTPIIRNFPRPNDSVPPTRDGAALADAEGGPFIRYFHILNDLVRHTSPVGQ
jgi:hypothetical protein